MTEENDAGGGPTGSRRSVARSVFYGVSGAIILWAGAVVPLPFVETIPGNPSDIPSLIMIEGYEVDDLDGSTALLTIQQRQQPTIPAFGALLDPDRSLQPVEEVFPQDIDLDVFRELQREQFGRQFDIAAAVGAQTAGIDVELITQVAVVDVLPGSPAAGLLAPGDIVVSADGQELTGAEELQAITATASPGDELSLAIMREGEEREVVATLAAVPDGDGARLGVSIETVLEELRLPFEVELREGNRIGGPSAGMMVGVTVYDLLADEDLLQGRTVVGTGTLSSGGIVGPVGGVAQKMQAAADYGADLVLVPASQLDIATAAAPEGLLIAGVESLDEAIEVLRREPV
jgi:PDZ domain-containing protein